MSLASQRMDACNPDSLTSSWTPPPHTHTQFYPPPTPTTTTTTACTHLEVILYVPHDL